MTRRRWIADEVNENRAALTGSHAEHLTRVLRARVGEEFDISTGSCIRRGRVASISEGRVEFELAEEVASSTQVAITLLLAVFKFDRMEWAIEKCTELGIACIVPVIAHRTDTHLASASAKRGERWRRVARQAAEQSRQQAPPDIPDPVNIDEAVGLSAALRIVLSESENETSLRGVLDSRTEGEMILAVGPEGGWTPEELQKFRLAGWVPASLGSTILRAETAAIAAIAIAASQFH